MIKKLNKKQLLAINSKNMYSRIIAGAGTGKTTVLIQRIFKLLNDNCDSEKILVLTFTNKAIKDIKDRLYNFNSGSEWQAKILNLKIFTYHAFALFLLNQVNNFDFIILSDRITKIKNIIKNYDLKNFNYTDAKRINDFISKYKKNKISHNHEKFIDFCLKRIKELKNVKDPKEIKKNKELIFIYDFFKLYSEIQIQEKLLDFDDLLIYAFNFLKNTHKLDFWKNIFTHILTDEFQDTNLIQYKIIKSIVNSKTNVFFVGDPNQCIYEWRGANPKIISELLEKDFNPLCDYFININYRSDNNILKLANFLIKSNYGDDKKLINKLASPYKDGEKININCFSSQDDETFFILEEIKKLKERGIKYSEIAILYRYKFFSFKCELIFKEKNIPFQIIGSRKFFDNLIVKQVCMFLSILISEDSWSLMQIINVPARKIGEKYIRKIINFSRTNKMNFYNSFVNNNKKISTNSKGNIFIDLILKYKKIISKYPKRLILSLRDFLVEIKYYEFLKNDQIRKNNIKYYDEIFSILQKKYINIRNFRTYLNEILLTNDSEKNNGDNINFLTIHSAKGLEFKVVFIINMSLENNKIKKNINEENRIYYVGFTRAKMHLYLSYIKNKNNILKILNSETISQISCSRNKNFIWDIKNNNNKNIDFNKFLNKNIIHPYFGAGTILKIFDKDDYILCECIFKNNVMIINMNYIINFCNIK